MEVFRLSRKKYANDLSGFGAAINGGRWNSPGVKIIYTASNRSLAMAEVAVHFTLSTLPSDYMMIKIYIPDKLSKKTVSVKELPPDWNTFPYHNTTHKIGDDFINENKYCLLKIPSAVTFGDHNILINPAHKEFQKVKILTADSFPFDYRIFK